MVEAKVPGTESAKVTHHPKQNGDVMLQGEGGQEFGVGQAARKAKETMKNGDVDAAKEQTSRVVGQEGVNKAKGVKADVQGYQEPSRSRKRGSRASWIR